ncbi:unnamed protein product, partial [Ectocarpus sp. 12 AP-2014]
PPGLLPDISSLVQLGDFVRQHPSLVLQVPEPPEHLGQGRVSGSSSRSSSRSSSSYAAVAAVFSPLPHERQHATGLAAVDEPVFGARATRYGLYPCRRPRGTPSITAGSVPTAVVIAASVLGSTIKHRSMPVGERRRAPGRRAEYGGEP